MHILLLGASIVVATLQSLFSRLYSDRYPRATGMASALAYAVFYGAFIGLATLALDRPLLAHSGEKHQKA